MFCVVTIRAETVNRLTGIFSTHCSVSKKRIMILSPKQILFSLPTAVSGALLSGWLDLHSICRLDSAICDKSNRIAFLNILQSVECVGTFYFISTRQLAWMNKRFVRSNFFIVNEDFPAEGCHNFLKRSGQYIRTVVESFCGTHLNLISQYCRNLTDLRLASHCQREGHIELFRVNPDIVELTLYCSISFPVKLEKLKFLKISTAFFNDLDYILLIKAASKLSFLTLPYVGVTASAIVEAAAYCPQLRFFEPPDLVNIDNTLLQMVPLCTQIVHMSMSGCQWLTDAGIDCVAMNLKSLRSIQFKLSAGITNACLLSLAEYQHHSLEIFIVQETNANSHTDKQLFHTNDVTLFRKKCTKLRIFEWKLSLQWHEEEFTNDIVNCIASADRITSLKIMRVNTSILESIAQYCVQLQEFDLWWINHAILASCSDALFLNIVESCKYLNTIFVADANQRARLQQLLIGYPVFIIDGDKRKFLPYCLENLYRKEIASGDF